MEEAVYRRVAVATGRERAAEAPGTELNRSLVFLTIGVALVFLACFLFYVWAHHQVIAQGYAVSQATGKGQELLEQNKKLRLELASLKSPRRIENMALKELGFVNPKKEQLIIVR